VLAFANLEVYLKYVKVVRVSRRGNSSSPCSRGHELFGEPQIRSTDGRHKGCPAAAARVEQVDSHSLEAAFH
jgi:hypothetical protein